MSDIEQMARLEERLRQVAEEHPACRMQLRSAMEEIKEIRERLARVEQGHEALEKTVLEMKKDLKEEIHGLKKFMLWAIGLGMTASGILVSILQLVLGR